MNLTAAIRIIFLLFVVAFSVGCEEYRAERAFEAAARESDQEDLVTLKSRYEEIIAKWPKSDAADRAREEIVWIDDLLVASARGPTLRAWDSVREVGHAAERYRLDRGRYPKSQDELVPRYLSAKVNDPWDNPVLYRKTKKGFQVVSYGSDGMPGGRGLAKDLLVDSDTNKRPER